MLARRQSIGVSPVTAKWNNRFKKTNFFKLHTCYMTSNATPKILTKKSKPVSTSRLVQSGFFHLIFKKKQILLAT